MDFLNIGDKINVKDLNAITYLLRKFKRLNTGLKLGSLSLESDYGSFVFDKPLTSVGGNFIIEEEVNISSRDCLRNCFYSFVFNVIDVNTSGSVNRRVVRVTGGTGDDGTLFVTLPTDLIESDEVILPNFELDIVFDEHEYYTPITSIIKVSLTVDKTVVMEGETATVTAVLLDENNEPLVDVPCNFFVNGVMFTETTDSDGVAVYEYTGTGSDSMVTVRVIDKTVRFEDKSIIFVTAVFTGDYIGLGSTYSGSWLVSVGDVVIDWGDGTSDTVNNPTGYFYHTYTDGLNEHTVTFFGEVTSLGEYCFFRSGLTSIEIPSSVTSLGDSCFSECTGLTSIEIPSSVTSLGEYCFNACRSLVDYQLYWRDSTILMYGSYKMPVNTNTVFTIPYGQTSNYVAKNYPSTKLTERSGGKTLTTLSIQSSKASYYTDESVTITGALIDEDNLPVESASVKLYQNNQLIYTLTTDTNGEYEKTLTGLNVGAYTFKAVYDGDNDYEASTSSNLNITVQNHTYSLSIASDKQTLLTTESVTISGTLLKDSTAFSGQSVTIYDGASVVDTLSTDGSGNYSKTISGLSVGVHTFKAVNSNAESSTISVTVNEPTPVHDYSLSVASTKDILSYADSESATITATLLDNGSAVAGETLSYTVKHGATVLDTGSDTTDSNGQISFNYTSTGVGDVTVEVDFGILLQETYDVIDYVSYDDATTDKASKYTIANLNSHTFSTDHYVAERTLSASASATYYSLVHETYNLPTDFEASVDLLVTNKSTSDHQFGLCISPDYPETYSGTNQCFLYSNRNRFALGYRINGSLSNYGAYNSDFSTNTWYTFYIKVQGTTVTTTIKQGSNTIQSYTGTHSNIQSWKKLMLVIGGNSNNMHWKNLKVKAL